MTVSTVRALVTALAIAAAGCVAGERSDLAAAQAAYDQCVEQRTAGDPECAALRERLRAAQQRYETSAQRAWGCVPEHGECPAHR